jgi:hypothetical protein
MNIQKNVGQTDKIVRLVLGVVLLAMIFVVEGNARWLGLIGIVPIVTALVGYCPAYTLLGVKTKSCGGCCGGGCKKDGGAQ